MTRLCIIVRHPFLALNSPCQLFIYVQHGDHRPLSIDVHHGILPLLRLSSSWVYKMLLLIFLSLAVLIVLICVDLISRPTSPYLATHVVLGKSSAIPHTLS